MLIEVRAVSVSAVDVRARVRRSATPEGFVLGSEGAGTVVEAGPQVSRFAPGDDVWWVSDTVRPGSNADYQVVDEGSIGLMPHTASWEEAAAVPLAAISAWEVLFDRLHLTENSTETLLIVGAHGPVGSVLLQLGRARFPRIRTIATISDDRDASWIRSLGADAVIDSRHDLVEQVDAAAPDGVDWIFTPNTRGLRDIGSTVFRPFGNGLIRRDGSGRAAGTGPRGVASHWDLVYSRDLERIPPSVDTRGILGRVAGMVDRGELRIGVPRRLYGLEARTLRTAHAFVEADGATGNVVVVR
ncbi:zinc-binding dehydrogenase [Leifsonia sp. NPDC077715]|uniref:alcohol dehydrogenase catalytic domain-containing protein n=1 Tax=Leifsonia sp. NPDC077715 TaxID=3155539 RepID=UPI0034203DE7